MDEDRQWFKSNMDSRRSGGDASRCERMLNNNLSKRPPSSARPFRRLGSLSEMVKSAPNIRFYAGMPSSHRRAKLLAQFAPSIRKEITLNQQEAMRRLSYTRLLPNLSLDVP